jgi:acetyl/propionyl-CoA carboxylase alpha subunit
MRYRFESGGRTYEVELERQGADDRYHALIDGQPFAFEVLDDQPGQLSLRIIDPAGGRPAVIHWAADGAQKWFSLTGCTYRLEKPGPRAAAQRSAPGAGESARAPMPAQVRAVQVAEGDRVEKGQTLLLLEAMKMEIRLRAPAAGRVRRLLAQPGQTVEKDQVLVEMEAE